MSKKLLLPLLLTLLSAAAHAQWQKLTTKTIADLEMSDVFAYNGRIIATGYTLPSFLGHLIVSEDDGKTWATKTMDQGILLKTIAFKDADTGYIGGMGGNTAMYQTTDGGKSWNMIMTDLNNTGIADMQFLNDRVGVASGYAHTQFSSGQCYRTYDGGKTWDTIPHQNLGCLDTLQMDYVQFLDAQTGYGRAEFLLAREMMKTTDSGKSFSLLYTHTTSIAGTHFWNVNNGILVDGNGDIFKTTDGGQTWTQQPNSIPTGFLNNVAFLNQTTGVAVGWGNIFRTTDGGATWKKEANIPNDAYLQRVRFHQNRGYAVARDGHIFRSEIIVNNVDDVLALNDQLSIYPNPANDILHISSYQGRYKNISATLTDLNGKILGETKTDNGMIKMETSRIAAGNYLLLINVEGKTTSSKITVTH